MTNQMTGVVRAAAGWALVLAMLAGLGGCTFGPCETPIVMLPVALVALPVMAGKAALDEQVLYALENTDLAVAGRVVDGDGRAVGGGTVDVTITSALRGGRDGTRLERVTTDAEGGFEVAVKGCKRLALRYSKAGYAGVGQEFFYDREEAAGSVASFSCSCHDDRGAETHFRMGRKATARDVRVVLPSSRSEDGKVGPR